VLYRADIPGVGCLWLCDRDIIKQEAMSGRFFYRVIHDTAVTEDPELDSALLHTLRAGTLLEASARRVVHGCLRVHIAGHNGRSEARGWASEYKAVAFDPRLGGELQLMRLRALPGSKADR